MPEIKITAEEMRYIALFQDLTRAAVRDCIIDNDNNRLIFLVRKGELGLAVGRGGSNVRRLRQLLNRDIEVVEYDDSLEGLAKSLFYPARVRDIKLVKSSNGRQTLYVTVDPRDKGLAIGRGGKTVSRARLVLKRYYNIDNVIVI